MSGSKPPKNTYLRGDVYWARLMVRGKEHRSSLHTDDAREARLRLKALRLRLEREAVGIVAAPSWKQAVVKWGDEVLPKAVKPAVSERYLSSIAQMTDVFGNLRMDQIDVRTVSAYVSSRSKHVTNATIRRDLTALSRLMSACVAWGWRQDNPVMAYDRTLVRERRDPIEPPHPETFDYIISKAPPGIARILRFLDQTGMRLNEAAQLEAHEVNWPDHQILLVRTKTSSPRALPWKTIAGDVSPILAKAPRKGFVFPNEDGVPYVNLSSNYGQLIDRLEREIGRQVGTGDGTDGLVFRPFRIHDLRHGFAIRWLKRGGNIYSLSRHLGHSSVKTTEMYLAYLTEEERQRVERAAMNLAQDSAQAPALDSAQG